MNSKRFLTRIVLALALLLSVSGAWAGEVGPEEDSVGDVDPTRPVIFSVREEYYRLKGGAWRDALIFRTDIIRLGGLRNLILRFDIPLAAADLGKDREYGLGDVYGQFVLVPYVKDNFAFAIGSGLTFPSASQDILGGGKWQIAPLVAPTWRFQDPRALFFVKVQDYRSLGGESNRPDIHYLTVTPFLGFKLAERWWAAADTEAKINWERENKRSYKSGVYVLRIWTKTFGTWIKPEIPWGENREGDWTVKVSCYWNY